MKNGLSNKVGRQLRLNIALFVAFCIVMIVGITVMRNQLLNNAKVMSTLLLDNYKITEEGALDTYKTLLRLATKFVNDKELENSSIQDIKDSLYPYLDGFYDLYAGDSVRSYGIIDGHIISNDKEIENLNNISYNYRDTEWYKGAMESEGAVYVSKGYTDYISGLLVVTLAQRVGDTEDVIAFDVFYHDYHGELRDLDLLQLQAIRMPRETPEAVMWGEWITGGLLFSLFHRKTQLGSLCCLTGLLYLFLFWRLYSYFLSGFVI
jgi:hypothetical protein